MINTNITARLKILVSKPAILVLTVFLLGTGVFLPTLGYDFVWDDGIMIKDNPLIRSFSHWPRFMAADIYMGQQYSFFYRPLVLFCNSSNYLLFHKNSWGYHLTNSLLHGINSSLVTYLAWLLLQNPYGALIAGAFFALHPSHTEAVTFLAARADLLVALFSLLTLVMAVKKTQKMKFLIFNLLLPLLFFLALLSKETAATILIPLALWLYQGHQSEPYRRRTLILKMLPAGLMLIPYLLLRHSVLQTFFTTNLQLIRYFSPLFLFELFLRYIYLLTFPFQRSSFLYYATSQPYPLDAKFWGMVVLTVLLSAALILIIRRKPETLPYFALLFLPLLPTLYYNLYNDTIMAERYLYLPSAGLALLLGWGFMQLPAGVKKGAGAGIVLLLVAYTGTTLWRAPLWKNEVTLFEAFKKEYPGSPYIRSTLGSVYEDQNRWQEAYQELTTAVKLDPEHPRYHVSLGWLCLQLGWTEKARQEFTAALIREPDHAPALEGMGVTLMQEGDYDKALNYLDMAYIANPRRTSILKNRELVLYAKQMKIKPQAGR